MLESTQSSEVLGIPCKYLDPCSITHSKFWHTSQQLWQKGIFPCNLISLGLYFLKVLMEILWVVLAKRLYIFQVCVILLFINRLPTNFLSGKGNDALSLWKNVCMESTLLVPNLRMYFCLLCLHSDNFVYFWKWL